MDLSDLTVADIMSSEFETVQEDENLSRALGKLLKGLSFLVVVDSNGNYRGIVSKHDVAHSKQDPSTEKVKSVMVTPPRLSPGDSVFKATKLLISDSRRYAPAIEGNRILGIVSPDSILSAVTKTEIGKLSAKDAMSSNITTINEADSIAKAISLFRSYNISHLPILGKNKKLSGIISMQDIIAKVVNPRRKAMRGERSGERIRELHTPVKYIMTSPVHCCSAKEKLKDIISDILSKDISSIVVKDDAQDAVGIITRKDIVELVSKREPEAPDVTISFARGHEVQQIDEIDFSKIMSEISNFVSKFPPFFKDSKVHVYIKRNKEQFRQRALYHIRLRLSSPKGMLVSHAENWGLELAVSSALERLRRQIIREKELSKEIPKDWHWEMLEHELHDIDR